MNLNKMRIACLGGIKGKVGRALFEGLTSEIGLGFPSAINPVKLLAENILLLGRPDNNSLVDRVKLYDLQKVDVIALAVKPGDVPAVARELAGKLQPHQLIISFAAIVPLPKLQEIFQHQQVARVMTTLGIATRAGDTAYLVDNTLSPSNKDLLLAILSSLGIVMPVSSDEAIDQHTIDAGCNLGYIAQILQYLAKAIAINSNVPEDLALDRVLANTLAACYLVGQSKDKKFVDLAQAVATPNGITADMLRVLEESQICQIFAACFKSASELIAVKQKKIK